MKLPPYLELTPMIQEKIFEAAAKRTMGYEGKRLQPYLDHLRYLTVGYGHLLAPREVSPDTERDLRAIGFFDHPYPEEVVGLWFLLDYKDALNDLQHLCGLRNVDLERLTPGRQMALLDLSFNLGLTRFGKFVRFWFALAQDDFPTTARELCWNDPETPTVYARQVGQRAQDNAVLLWEG